MVSRMKFELQYQSVDFLSSSYAFPGDESVSQEVYRKCITSGYVSSVCTLTGAAESFGLDIDAETFERWKRMGAAGGLIDDFIDDSPDPGIAHELYNEGLARSVMLVDGWNDISPPPWTDDRLLPAIKLLANSVEILPGAQIEKLVAAAKIIGESSITKSECADTKKYIRLLKQEALATSMLIYDSASDVVREQNGFEAFTVWCRNAMELGTLADSSRDLWVDNRNELTKVGATVLNSVRIARHLHRPIRAMIHPRSNLIATCRSLLVRRKFYK